MVKHSRKKKKIQLKKYFILTLVLSVLYFALHITLADGYRQRISPRCLPVEHTEQINQAELDAFLEVWPIYQSKKFNQKENWYISLLSGRASEKLPWHMRFWLFKNCWNADRFYYVEQRLREILHTSFMRLHSKDVIEILQKLIEEENNAAKIEAYKQLIELQKKIADIEKIGDDELALVQGREAEIEAILAVSAY